MTDLTRLGYAGKILRVDLTAGTTRIEELNEATVRKWVGGVGLAVKILYDEVPAGVEWDDPENRFIISTGPLAGTGVAGAATINFTAKNPMTNIGVATQANGFMGAYMKFSGFDAIVFSGRSPKLVYLVLKNGGAEIRDATHLTDLDALEIEDKIREDLEVSGKQISVFGIGPAGENLVRYAAVSGDKQHVASKGGMGAVMGSKNLKAVVAYDGPRKFEVYDSEKLKSGAKELLEFAKGFGTVYEWGSGGGFSTLHALGALPVKNYTTDIFPEHEQMNGQYLRTHYEFKSVPCYRCGMAHVKEVTVTEGPYKGFVGEEPEYEQLAAWGPQIGNTDLGAVVMLTKEVDRLALDCNEASWVVGWAMECFEKGVFTKADTEGLELTWGNVEAARELLNRIARRDGPFADMLAEGVMRASLKVGGEAANWAIYGAKGVTPRSHDHRGETRWYELLDSCVTTTSTLDATWGGVHPQLVDLQPLEDHFDHLAVAKMNADFSGPRLFDDCLGICRFASPAPKLVLRCFNAVTGWDWDMEDVFKVGRRVSALFRLFALRNGHSVEDEKPSTRYWSPPVDGPNKGVDIGSKWPEMIERYYTSIGWDPKTGRPTDDTLIKLDLKEYLQQD